MNVLEPMFTGALLTQQLAAACTLRSEPVASELQRTVSAPRASALLAVHRHLSRPSSRSPPTTGVSIMSRASSYRCSLPRRTSPRPTAARRAVQTHASATRQSSSTRCWKSSSTAGLPRSVAPPRAVAWRPSSLAAKQSHHRHLRSTGCRHCHRVVICLCVADHHPGRSATLLPAFAGGLALACSYGLPACGCVCAVWLRCDKVPCRWRGIACTSGGIGFGGWLLESICMDSLRALCKDRGFARAFVCAYAHFVYDLSLISICAVY